ncbi:MAG: NAD-dependent epimerase/dehydratase family protein [Chloroflexi bacterium]|nr:NAD-dependent epimerase/dehydratase family protein [Chloroflexota bacterium]MBU1752066.1 NAD-dependent epimerase/dehydratase family protein [Chloroflexota bacterium]MBU1878839.1 NAD-dependent epimerase/dehydratase family protein [Chloroflexota bacterium]
MTVLLTGAGHLGANLARALVAQGHQVRVMVYRDPQASQLDRQALAGLDVDIVEGDVLDPVSLALAFQGIDTVYHTVGYISILMSEWPRLEAINVQGVRHVVQTSLDCGIRRLVHISSIHALQQEPLDEPLDESRGPADAAHHLPYDRSKALGEREMRRGIEQGLDAVILNPTGILGPFDFRPSFFGQVLLQLSQCELPALVDGGFDWVDARDVAQGAIRAAERAPAGAQYLLSGHWVSLADIARQASALTGVPAPRWTAPMWLARLGVPLTTAWARLRGRQPFYTAYSLQSVNGCNRRISHAWATRDLGYQPRPFPETLADTLQWFADAGQLSCAIRTPGALGTMQ